MNTIRKGSVGPDVATWQAIIGVDVDGAFGPATAAATRAWQLEHALVADGIVGPATWAAAGVVAPELAEVLKGTDMSAIQGIRPDSEWRALAEMGIRFAILRSIVGNETWSDSAAVENARRARAHGIEAWPYIFLYPLPHLSPDAQAEGFVRRLEAMGLLGGPVASDAEWPPREEWKVIDGVKTLTYPWLKWGCSAPQIREWLARFLTRLEELIARRSIVYSYRYWLKCIEAHLLPELADRPLWLADYGYSGRWPTREQCAAIRAPAPWSKIAILQHDGNGGLRLPQSGMDADFNVFFGGEAELQALVGARLDETPATLPEMRIDPGVRLATNALMVEDAIAAYRRERIDEAA